MLSVVLLSITFELIRKERLREEHSNLLAIYRKSDLYFLLAIEDVKPHLFRTVDHRIEKRKS